MQVAIDRIRYFEVRNRIVTVYYQKDDGKAGEFEFYSSLSKIEEYLYGKMFVRIHSSYLVGERFILSKSKKEIVLTSGEVLPVGRAYAGNLKNNSYFTMRRPDEYAVYARSQEFVYGDPMKRKGMMKGRKVGLKHETKENTDTFMFSFYLICSFSASAYAVL